VPTTTIAFTSRIVQLAALAIPAVCFASAACAKAADQDQPEESGSSIASEEEAREARRAAGKGGGWRLEPGLRVTARGIAARSTAPGEDEIIDGNALAVLVAPSLVLTKDDVAVTFRNITTRLEFEDPDRLDRWQNLAQLGVRFDLSDSTAITAFGERADNILAAEFTSTDEWEFGGEIEHSFDRRNRVLASASWRERSYDDETGSTGSGIRVNGEYRYRFRPNTYAFLRGRHDVVNSANDRRNLERWLFEASYQQPIARDLRLRTELTYERLGFGGRILPGGSARQDDLFWPELTLTWTPGPWRLQAEGRYIFRSSNDPAFDRSGYRFEVEVSHAF
jgi:hypothetical protein